MKSLTDIYQRQLLTEPRLPITNVPYTISQSGSYYLTTNFVSGQTCISITASNVVVDLMGYTLSTTNLASTVLLSGVTNAPLLHTVVRNGVIRGSYYGVNARNVAGCNFDGLLIDGCSYGIYLDCSNGGQLLDNVLSGCRISGCGNNGLVFYGSPNGIIRGNVVEDCQVINGVDHGFSLVGGEISGNTFRNCRSTCNAGFGFSIDISSGGSCSGNLFSGLILFGNSNHAFAVSAQTSGRFSDNTLYGCTISGNGNYGISLYAESSGTCTGNRMESCIVSRNTVDGLVLDGSHSGNCSKNTILSCSVVDNSHYGIRLDGSSSGKCNDNTVQNCMVSGNAQCGIRLDGSTSGQCNGNSVQGCTADGNGADGIEIDTAMDNRVQQCRCSRNTYNGIWVKAAQRNRIEDNQCCDQPGTYCGITSGASCSNNWFLRNICAGQTNNFNLATSDIYGPIVTNTGSLYVTGVAAHAWANFER